MTTTARINPPPIIKMLVIFRSSNLEGMMSQACGAREGGAHGAAKSVARRSEWPTLRRYEVDPTRTVRAGRPRDDGRDRREITRFPGDFNTTDECLQSAALPRRSHSVPGSHVQKYASLGACPPFSDIPRVRPDDRAVLRSNAPKQRSGDLPSIRRSSSKHS
jgi:hypothetical protein